LNAESLKSRIEFLNSQAKQMEINLHAIGGAIQDCQYWLTQLESKDATNQNSSNDVQLEA
jgi:prefoldin subunit 5